jgi:hypothetical protein
MATDQAVVAVDCDHSVKGHRRAIPEFDDVSGFRVWEVSARAAWPLGVVPGSAVLKSDGVRLAVCSWCANPWQVVPTPEPTRTFGTRVFGLSQGAAIPNLALVWPQRFTWHSDFQVRSSMSCRLCSLFAHGRAVGRSVLGSECRALRRWMCGCIRFAHHGLLV